MRARVRADALAAHKVDELLIFAASDNYRVIYRHVERRHVRLAVCVCAVYRRGINAAALRRSARIGRVDDKRAAVVITIFNVERYRRKRSYLRRVEIERLPISVHRYGTVGEEGRRAVLAVIRYLEQYTVHCRRGAETVHRDRVRRRGSPRHLVRLRCVGIMRRHSGKPARHRAVRKTARNESFIAARRVERHSVNRIGDVRQRSLCRRYT